MIYVNKDTQIVEIPKSGNIGQPRQIRLLNQLTNIDIYTEIEDLGNDPIMYAFNIESIVKDLVVGQYDYFILDANGSVLDNGILQYDSFNSSVSAYSLDDPKVIQYSLGDVYTPIPETIKTVFVDGVYDTDGVDKVNVNTGVENQYVEDLLKDVVSKQWVEEQGFLTDANLEEVVDEVLATKDYISETELKTINGQSIIGTGDIEIKPGTDFDPAVLEDYATKEWVGEQGFLTEVPADYVTETELTDKNYATQAWVEDQNYLKDIPAEYITETELTGKNYATQTWVGEQGFLTEVPAEYASKEWVEDQSYLKDIPDEYVTESELSGKNYATQAWVEEQGFLTEVPADYITETELKTINGQSLIGSGNIEIEGGTGGGASFTDITQAEYDALVSSGSIDENTVYNITDATPIVIEDYALKTELDAIANSLPTTYNPYNTTTSSTSGYKFPKWNERGQITGTYSTAYQASQNINGSSRTIYSTSSSSMPTIYAPTSAGQAGQVLLSNGSGAPVWSEYKSDATAYLLHNDFANGTYSTSISEYYLECIATNQVKPMQFVFTSTVQDGEVTNTVYSSYLPSSGRIYAGNVELWLLYTEDCISWTNHHYLITNTEVSLTTTTGTFGGQGWK